MVLAINNKVCYYIVPLEKRTKRVLKETTTMNKKFTYLVMVIIAFVVMAVGITAAVYSVVTPKETHRNVSSYSVPMNGLIVPMDIQPAGGYKLLNDTYNPQQ